MRPFFTAAALACALVPGLAGAAETAPGPTPTPADVLMKRGFITPRDSAEHAIRFKPFVPAATIRETALLPPFHDNDETSKKDGIGYAYEHAGHRFALLQWPKQGGNLVAFPTLALDKSCPDTHGIGGEKTVRAIAWTTRRGNVMILHPDDLDAPDARAQKRLRAEYRRLVRRGACR